MSFQGSVVCEAMGHKYDTIGVDYAASRRPDPRIDAKIHDALTNMVSIVNVGAGTGSYEPRDRDVVAVEPSATMIMQRTLRSAPVVQAIAEALPFGDGAFDASLAIFTLHHWNDPIKGLRELRRVSSRRIVILTWDQDVWESYWLLQEYFPSIAAIDRKRTVSLELIAAELGQVESEVVPIPFDCIDGFDGAYWQRPAAYLDPQVRLGISSFAELSAEECNDGLRKLASDIDSGAWESRHGGLLELDSIDLGYRLLVSGSHGADDI